MSLSKMILKYVVGEIILYCTLSCLRFSVSQTVGDTEVVYSWVSVDFTWESEDDREEAIADGTFIPENCLVSGMKVIIINHISVMLHFDSICDSIVNQGWVKLICYFCVFLSQHEDKTVDKFVADI